MNTKKYKRFDNVIDDYINLLDEQIELPVLIQKASDKLKGHLNTDTSSIHKPKEVEDMFKAFTQIKKHEERKAEITSEIAEVENIMKDFLSRCNGGKISYEKTADNNKSKINILFWLEGSMIKSNI